MMNPTSLRLGLLIPFTLTPLMAEEPVPVEFEVKSTVVREIQVVEPPPMIGLPPVVGTVTATMHLVADPGLPDPTPAPAPVTPAPPESPGEAAAPGWLTPVSGIWYPREQLCRVTWTYQGESFECLSRRNFQHLVGIGGLPQSGGAEQGPGPGPDTEAPPETAVLVMGIAVEDTQVLEARALEQGLEWQAPVFPEIPAGQDFLVTAGDMTHSAALQVMVDLHEKFRLEGPQLAAAWQAREQQQAARRAWLEAHPPAPADVTFHFWARSHPVGMGPETIIHPPDAGTPDQNPNQNP